MMSCSQSSCCSGGFSEDNRKLLRGRWSGAVTFLAVPPLRRPWVRRLWTLVLSFPTRALLVEDSG